MRGVRWAFAALLGLGQIVLFVFVLLSPQARQFPQEEWFEFLMPWDDRLAPLVELESPAGRSGFVQINSQGQFVFENGQRARFWGVEIRGELLYPPKEIAQKLARRLARLGFNLVRFMEIERALLLPNALEPRFHAQRLDQFDYFVSQLKENGIYIDIVLAFPSPFSPQDGVIDWDAPALRNSYEGQRLLYAMAFADPYLFTLQKQRARLFFSHRNPYTGKTYVEEPTIAMVEIINETTLTYAWLRGLLNADSPEAIKLTPHYSSLLDVLWNLWLSERYPSRESLRMAWASPDKMGLMADEDPMQGTVRRILYAERQRYSPRRVSDLLRFYSELEQTYFRGFAEFLHREVGVRVPISGTHIFHGMAAQLAQTQLDFAGSHIQWQHPFLRGSQSWRAPPIRLLNTPMVKGEAANIPYKADWIETKNTIFRLAYGATAQGKPFVVSEYNHAFPNEYQAEFPVIMAAYAGFQDWDGFIVHAYGASVKELESPMILDIFQVHNNPAVLTQMPVASLLFRRGDVAPARQLLTINYSQSAAFEAFLECGLDIYCVLARTKIDPAGSLIHRVRNQFSAAATDLPSSRWQSPYVSDTRELTWDLDRGLVLVDTDKVQAAIGFVGGQAIRLRYVTIQAQTDFAAIALISLDGQPIPSSQRLLLTAVSRVKNQDMVVTRDLLGFYQLTDWGHAPIVVQDVRARLELATNASLRLYPLDAAGNPKQGLPLESRGRSIVNIGGQNTLWYLLAAHR
jgi:hypothetical protein